jgi:hypothetical protein
MAGIGKSYGLKRSDSAVSEIYGELMLMFITVAVFMILATSINSMMSQQDSRIISTSFSTNDTSISIKHEGGDGIGYRDVSVIVDSVPYNSTAQKFFMDDSNSNNIWDIGESIKINDIDVHGSKNVLLYDLISGSTIAHYGMEDTI